MYSKVEQRLARLLDAGGASLLAGGQIGLEKESLRVRPAGTVSQAPHPPALGAAIAHPFITTDYSEALLEFVTPPFAVHEAVLAFLHDAHRFVYENLEDEVLWATSMPCILEGEKKIPIARYGSSNAGLMKSVYRRGLGFRYGRAMQVIAGVHFNYSLAEGFWPLYQDLEGDGGPLRQFIDASYMAMIRNLQRLGWLIPYLFGASPAVCGSFLGGKAGDLERFDASSYYYPYATSLRMGDIGYQNSLEEGKGFKANYDSLDSYIRSLTWAIQTPCPDYEKIGVRVAGRYRQLNASVLQIENEHYGTVRPKQIPEGIEKPTLGLRRRGVRYVELRSLDVNAYHPLGVDAAQLYFLETLLLFCLLADSPRISPRERTVIDHNQVLAAHRGRDPRLRLLSGDRAIPLRDWASEILTAMRPFAEVLDRQLRGHPHQQSLDRQMHLVRDPEFTPSARMLRDMRANREGFFQFAQRMSHAHRRYFQQTPLSAERQRFFREQARQSMLRAQALEEGDSRSFDDFLREYFAQ